LSPHTLDEKHAKNGTMSLKFFTLIISAYKNNVAKLHLHSLHHSGEINNNVLKLFYLICKLFTVEVWQRWKQLQSSIAETTASFYKMCNHFSVERVSSHMYF
jgi:hypothetical protein